MRKLKSDRQHKITFILDGRRVSGDAEPRFLLSDFLRETFGVNGVHVGCEHGICGACTVHIDGKAVRACLTLAVQVDNRQVDTVESLGNNEGELNDLQSAFRKHHALQCGFCTPGILMSAEHYLRHTPDPTESDVRDMLSGHLCRCTGYIGMVRAITETAAKRKSSI